MPSRPLRFCRQHILHAIGCCFYPMPNDVEGCQPRAERRAGEGAAAGPSPCVSIFGVTPQRTPRARGIVPGKRVDFVGSLRG